MIIESLYTVTGVVQRNVGRGTKLGFPTANTPLDQEIPDGIYVAETTIMDSPSPNLAHQGRGNNGPIHSLAFVGAPLTFGDTTRSLELYLLDWNGDLYGRQVTAKLLQKIRGNKRFETQEELIAEMKNDERIARKYFNAR